MLTLVNAKDENYSSANLRNLLHSTYMHGNLDGYFGMDLFNVDESSIKNDKESGTIWQNYVKFREDKEFKQRPVWVTSEEDVHYLINATCADIIVKEVKVANYPNRCVLFLKMWVEPVLVDKQKHFFYPNVKTSGIVVDIADSNECIDYVLSHSDNMCEGPGYSKSVTKKELEFRIWLIEHQE